MSAPKSILQAVEMEISSLDTKSQATTDYATIFARIELVYLRKYWKPDQGSFTKWLAHVGWYKMRIEGMSKRLGIPMPKITRKQSPSYVHDIIV